MIELYLSDLDTTLASLVLLLEPSSGNIAIVYPCCDRVLVVRKSALALEIQLDFRQLLKSEHPGYFFLSLRCYITHGLVTATSHPREISGIFMQCVGQLICVPPCHEYRNAPRPSTTSNCLFFNVCVTAGDKDDGIARLYGSCFVQPDPKQTYTPTQITSSVAYALYYLLYKHSTSQAFQYLPKTSVSGKIENRVLEDW